jgi:hypothetical protein
MDGKTQIGIALRAGIVAKSALDMVGMHDDLVMRLMGQKLVEDVNGLLGAVKAAAEGKESPDTSPNRPRQARGN